MLKCTKNWVRNPMKAEYWLNDVMTYHLAWKWVSDSAIINHPSPLTGDTILLTWPKLPLVPANLFIFMLQLYLSFSAKPDLIQYLEWQKLDIWCQSLPTVVDLWGFSLPLASVLKLRAKIGKMFKDVKARKRSNCGFCFIVFEFWFYRIIFLAYGFRFTFMIYSFIMHTIRSKSDDIILNILTHTFLGV